MVWYCIDAQYTASCQSGGDTPKLHPDLERDGEGKRGLICGGGCGGEAIRNGDIEIPADTSKPTLPLEAPDGGKEGTSRRATPKEKALAKAPRVTKKDQIDR